MRHCLKSLYFLCVMVVGKIDKNGVILRVLIILLKYKVIYQVKLWLLKFLILLISFINCILENDRIDQDWKSQ